MIPGLILVVMRPGLFWFALIPRIYSSVFLAEILGCLLALGVNFWLPDPVRLRLPYFISKPLSNFLASYPLALCSLVTMKYFKRKC